MTFNELTLKYSTLYKSNLVANRQKAKGFLDIINEYRKTSINEYSESVKISEIAEAYAEKELNLYNITKVTEHKFKYMAAKECIIKYTTIDEITRLLGSLTTDRKDFSSYIDFMSGIGYMDRTRLADLHSAWELANIS